MAIREVNGDVGDRLPFVLSLEALPRRFGWGWSGLLRLIASCAVRPRCSRDGLGALHHQFRISRTTLYLSRKAESVRLLLLYHIYFYRVVV